MRKNTDTTFWLTFWIVIFALLFTSPLRSDGLTEAEFEELRNILIPSQKESWTTIPWNLNLLKAQAKAGAERKPIFIWAMNGHPMACV